MGLAGAMPFAAVEDDPILTQFEPQISVLSLLQNGVARVAGSYLFRNRVDAVIGTLDAADVQAWDLRVDGINPVADATFPEFQIAPPVAAVNYLWNGTTFDRQASAGAASVAADPVVGAMLVTEPGEWTENDGPAANTQSTATHAAGGAAERHICKSITATLIAGATASNAISVRLRDGITGVGTILWRATMTVPIGVGQSIVIPNINIIGSVATAMTLEFAGAAGVTTIENVAMSGITVG